MNTHRKGSTWTRSVAALLDRAGFQTTTRGIGYAGDDVTAKLSAIAADNVDEVVLSIEAKNTSAVTLAAWIAQARENCGPAHPVVWAHRKGRAAPEDGYVVMTGADFLALLAALHPGVDLAFNYGHEPVRVDDAAPAAPVDRGGVLG